MGIHHPQLHCIDKCSPEAWDGGSPSATAPHWQMAGGPLRRGMGTHYHQLEHSSGAFLFAEAMCRYHQLAFLCAEAICHA